MGVVHAEHKACWRKVPELTGQNDFKVQLRAKPWIVEEVQKGLRQEMLSLTLLSKNLRRVGPWAGVWEEDNPFRREAAI